MKVWSAIFNIFAVLLLVMLSLSYLNVTKVMTRDFDQVRLNQAVEYSTEAAFLGTLSVEDIDIDYSNLDVVSINPSNALDLFETMMCFNYDLSTSKPNKDVIRDSIAIGVLSGSDGFYITQTSQDDTTPGNGVDGGEYTMRWSAKIPYLYKSGNKTYALNIKKQSWVSISNAGLLEIPVDVGYPSGLSEETILSAVNAQITNTMVEEIERKNINGNTFGFKFFLPVETTKSGVNPIDGPGILILLQGAPFASSERISAVSVSGYQTTTRINLIAFTENISGVDRKYYCYEGQMDPADIGSRYIVDNYYRNTVAAAKAGYAPHYGLLAKKITRR